MTTDEKKRIERLRNNRNSFSRIAEITGLRRDSVRMYCSRKNIVPGKSGDFYCQQCGKELTANFGKGRQSSVLPATASSVRVRRKGTEWNADVFLY